MNEPQIELKKLRGILDAWEPLGCADHNYYLAEEILRRLDTRNQTHPIPSYGTGRLVLLREAMNNLNDGKGSFDDHLSSARHYISRQEVGQKAAQRPDDGGGCHVTGTKAFLPGQAVAELLHQGSAVLVAAVGHMQIDPGGVDLLMPSSPRMSCTVSDKHSESRSPAQ